MGKKIKKRKVQYLARGIKSAINLNWVFCGGEGRLLYILNDHKFIASLAS
jgi:hypothetical protein